jgi:hypothetical protein
LGPNEVLMEDEATSEPARAAMERTDLTIEARLVHLAHYQFAQSSSDRAATQIHRRRH